MRKEGDGVNFCIIEQCTKYSIDSERDMIIFNTDKNNI